VRGLLQGDGTPILITMRTEHIWVPLEVLAIEGQQVQADLYLLTDQPVYTTDLDAMVGQSSVGSQVPGAPGFVLSFQEKMTPTLIMTCQLTAIWAGSGRVAGSPT
jgi:hypothetical protein